MPPQSVSRVSALSAALSAALVRANAALRRHPRRVTTGLLSVLAGTAVTAFGIAPLAPDAADLPQRLVSEEVSITATSEFAAQIDALASHTLQLTRSDNTRSSDTADSLLRRLGVNDADAARFLRTDRDARRLIDGRAGKMVQVRSQDDGRLIELVARFPAPEGVQSPTHAQTLFTRLTISVAGGAFSSRLELAPLVAQVRMGGGTIRNTLFAATDEARLPDAIASQLIDIFSTEIDFHRQLRKGDTFSVVYEGLTADDLPITWNDATGRVLSAEFVNNGRSSQATWFKDATGKGAYFGFDGQSKRRAFLASPMTFSRVSSSFAMRMHPILQTWRAHNGVDYGAPTGTPVRAVGDGMVEQAGWHNGYGNVVSLLHGNGRSTLYAHLSKIDVKKGQHIEQGQQVGLVGATGWATGPHLHFEFRVDGQFQDPLRIARAADTVTVDAASRPRFAKLASSARVQLVAAQATVGYRGDAE